MHDFYKPYTGCHWVFFWAKGREYFVMIRQYRDSGRWYVGVTRETYSQRIPLKGTSWRSREKTLMRLAREAVVECRKEGRNER